MTEEGSIPDRIADRAVALAPDPTADLDDLAPLASAFEGRRIVGLGEATHGTAEFVRLKHLLVRFLVERLGCRAVAWEANFSETLALDRYVRYGEGDPAAALDGLHVWPWNAESVLATVEWLRTFNLGRPPEDRVGLYGVDAQFSAGPAAALRGYLEAVDPAYLDRVGAGLRDLERRDVKVTDDETFADRQDDVEGLLSDVEERFEDHRDAYESATDPAGYRLARRHLRTLRQAFEARRARAHDPAVGYALRDRHMAENASWIREYADADPLVLWAHNGHVRTDEVPTGDGSGYDPMGRHLREEFGDGYYALGVEFGRGRLRAVPASDSGGTLAPGTERFRAGAPIEGSTPDTLAAVDPGSFFLDFEAVGGDPDLAAWLDAERPVHDVGATFDPDDRAANYRSIVPGDAFDGLAFVAETTPTVPVEK